MKTALVALAAALAAWGQSQRPRDLGPGKLLVAARELADPNFSQAVVLLVKHDATSAMGVVLTRESRYTIGRLFPEIAKSNETRAYVGGPVSRAGVIALGRSKQAPAGADAVVGDVWMTADKALLERMIRENANPETFRVYLGYTGWGGRQLENEVEHGAWHIFNADPAAAFAADVKGLWERYMRRVEAQIAMVRAR
ncbi:MAG: YqgE/AlgH family protein [Bryobacterales bacterium]|nr:YqgE/AlgH family protein [Bryobacterales bacterium]